MSVRRPFQIAVAVDVIQFHAASSAALMAFHTASVTVLTKFHVYFHAVWNHVVFVAMTTMMAMSAAIAAMTRPMGFSMSVPLSSACTTAQALVAAVTMTMYARYAISAAFTAKIVVPSATRTPSGVLAMICANAVVMPVAASMSGRMALTNSITAPPRLPSAPPPAEAISWNCAKPSLPFRLVAQSANALVMLSRPPVMSVDMGKNAATSPPNPRAMFLTAPKKFL